MGQVSLGNITSNAPNQNHVSPAEYGERNISVMFLTKMPNLHPIMRIHQNNPNEGLFFNITILQPSKNANTMKVKNGPEVTAVIERD